MTSGAPASRAPSRGAAPTHWDEVWSSRGAGEVSWFRAEPTTSLRLVDGLGLRTGDAVVDVGGGASTLPARLLDRGLDVTVLDLSGVALDAARRSLGVRAGEVHWVEADVTTWSPPRTFALWHDRAVFHFLVDPADQDRYVAAAAEAVGPGGALVLATFAPDGPSSCSGLPVARHDADDLAVCFSSAFALEVADREVHRTPAGGDQPFTWVVLRRHAG